MIEAINSFNVNFDNYFKALCQEFPVASTGVTINIIYEIVYENMNLHMSLVLFLMSI